MPPNDEHGEDWMFDFPELDREPREWRDRIERDGYEKTERENVGKLIVSKALQSYGRTNPKGSAA